MVEATALIRSQNISKTNNASWQESLLKKLLAGGRKCFSWQASYDTDLALPESNSISTLARKRREDKEKWINDFRGGCQWVRFIYSRLYVALGGNGAHIIEQGSQCRAAELAALHRRHANDHRFPKPVALTLAIGAVQATSEEWMEFSESANCRAGKLVSADMFLRWAKLMGINVDAKQEILRS